MQAVQEKTALEKEAANVVAAAESRVLKLNALQEFFKRPDASLEALSKAYREKHPDEINLVQKEIYCSLGDRDYKEFVRLVLGKEAARLGIEPQEIDNLLKSVDSFNELSVGGGDLKSFINENSSKLKQIENIYDTFQRPLSEDPRFSHFVLRIYGKVEEKQQKEVFPTLAAALAREPLNGKEAEAAGNVFIKLLNESYSGWGTNDTVFFNLVYDNAGLLRKCAGPWLNSLVEHELGFQQKRLALACLSSSPDMASVAAGLPMCFRWAPVSTDNSTAEKIVDFVLERSAQEQKQFFTAFGKPDGLTVTAYLEAAGVKLSDEKKAKLEQAQKAADVQKTSSSRNVGLDAIAFNELITPKVAEKLLG